jgi:hypothetical protein
MARPHWSDYFLMATSLTAAAWLLYLSHYMSVACH